MRATKLEVNINDFLNNVEMVKNYVPGKKIMPVVKANAYGTYLNYRLDVLNRFDIVAVALVDEGVFLREIGYQGDILVLNQPSADEIDIIEEYQLSIGISDVFFLNKCIEKKATFPVHLEIETGMNRTGITSALYNLFSDLLKKSQLQVKGIYTHFSSADYDEKYTEQQIGLFQNAMNIFTRKGFTFQYVHVSASSALLNYRLPFTNLVRPGILLYGYNPYIGSENILPVKPICTWKTQITFVKNIPEGEAISYSQKFVTKKNSVIATIPVGYADGYRRCLMNIGYVFVNGKKAPIVGTVCMDSCMIDVTDIICHVGDEVILMDEENVTADYIAELYETINYEVISTIAERVPRIFIGGPNE